LLKDLLKRYTGVDRPRSVNPISCRRVAPLPYRDRPATVQWRRVARVSHANLDARVVRHDGAVGLAGRNLRDNGGNLASHFGAWVAMPVVSYAAGTLQQYSACIYIGSTYGEPLPAAFLTDVYAGTTKVIWIYDNIWQLTSSQPQFAAQYGFMPSVFDTSPVATVTYKSQSLKRYSAIRPAS